MPVTIDQEEAIARGRREILRDLNKANEADIDQLVAQIKTLVVDVATEAPPGWRAALDANVDKLKTAVTRRKELKDAMLALP
jgi:hypothetical protein